MFTKLSEVPSCTDKIEAQKSSRSPIWTPDRTFARGRTGRAGARLRSGRVCVDYSRSARSLRRWVGVACGSSGGTWA